MAISYHSVCCWLVISTKPKNNSSLTFRSWFIKQNSYHIFIFFVINLNAIFICLQFYGISKQHILCYNKAASKNDGLCFKQAQ